MGMLEELNDLLDRLPLWARIKALPDKVETLQQRVALLEAQFSGKPGELCPVCNAPGFRRTGSKPDPVMGALGVMLDSYVCAGCGHAEDRPRDTMG